MSTSTPLPPRRIAPALVATLALTVLASCGGGPTPPSSTGSSGPAPSGPPFASPAPSGTRGPSASAPATSFDPAAVAIDLELVAETPADPLAIVTAGDDGRLYVAEQSGSIWIIENGERLAAPFLDIADRISAGGERGLLGLAFHPDYPADPRFFVDYTNRAGDTVVASFRVSDDRDRADSGSETPILGIDQPYANHNGGGLAFGPDGRLYVSSGDGGAGGDPHDNGQRLDTLLGKILRIDVDGSDGDRNYRIPDDNPFVDRGPARPEIWLTGLRNPWRMSFDRSTGDLWIGDVGQGRWEEIDVARATAGGGANYGWNRMEGRSCYPSGDGCERPEITLPVAQYPTADGCAVMGGNVYRGTTIPALVGGYVFADFCSGTIYVIDAAADSVEHPTEVLRTGRTISSFGEDAAGELYVTDLASGGIYRLVQRG